MTDDDNRDVLAAEYVLGTLDPEERAQAESLIAHEPAFAAAVRNWERRLGELNVLVAPVEPPPALLDAIKARIAGIEPTAAQAGPPEAAVPLVPDPTLERPAAPREPAREPDGAQIIELTRRLTRWRGLAIAAGSIAAVLAALAAVLEWRPDLMPASVQPVTVEREVIKVVEVPSPKPAQYVAVLQKDAASPAFLLTFDLERRSLTVRTVGAERQAGKSYELWLVSDRFTSPRSLGVIGMEEFTSRPQLAAYDAVTINAATYAVSLEPEGGSPTGAPTGPVVFSGKLLQATPPGFFSPTP